jgi:transcriptional regulator with XRE-family HTH domain
MNHSLSERLKQFTKTDEFQKKSALLRRRILLGEKIYGRRKDLALSQTALSQRVGTTQRIISELEDGVYAPKCGIGDDLYDRLAMALEIDRDYLMSAKIDRRTFELLAYIGQKLNWRWDIMQFMKIPYFVDLDNIRKLGFQISNFEYIRYEFGPFDVRMYSYRTLFESKKYETVQFLSIADLIETIDKTMSNLPVTNGKKLKELSYDTVPMRKIKATMGGREGWGERLEMLKNKAKGPA